MSFWGDVGEGIGVRYCLVVCFLLFFLSLLARSWFLFGICVAVLLSGTWDLWVWWLPGMSRREKYKVKLEGAAQRKERTQDPHGWLVRAIRSVRELGFFEMDRERSDESLADMLEQAHRNLYGTPFDAANRVAPYLLLSADPNRAWVDRTRRTEDPEVQVYVRALEEWGRISCGAFAPRDLSEVRQGTDGPVLIEFTQDGRRHMFEVEESDGSFDFAILKEVNRAIAASGRQFEVFSLGHGGTMVICLTPDERRSLMKLGWA